MKASTRCPVRLFLLVASVAQPVSFSSAQSATSLGANTARGQLQKHLPSAGGLCQLPNQLARQRKRLQFSSCLVLAR